MNLHSTRSNSRPKQQRRTQQRDAIKDALAVAGRPLSPLEIQAAAQERVPGLGIATVYRNIKILVDEGLVQEVELPGAPNRYELAGKGHHHHFYCRTCHSVFEVEACPQGLRDLAPSGFALEGHEITLYGICRTCNDNTSK